MRVREGPVRGSARVPGPARAPVRDPVGGRDRGRAAVRGEVAGERGTSKQLQPPGARRRTGTRHERKRRELLTQIHQYEQADIGQDQNADLIDLLPRLSLSVSRLPEKMQRLIYDAYQLEGRYLRPRRQIEIQVTIPAATVGELADLTGQAVSPPAADTAADQSSFECPRQDSNLRPSA